MGLDRGLWMVIMGLKVYLNDSDFVLSDNYQWIRLKVLEWVGDLGWQGTERWMVSGKWGGSSIKVGLPEIRGIRGNSKYGDRKKKNGKLLYYFDL